MPVSVEQPSHGSGRADDGKCAVLPRQEGSSAQYQAKAAGIQELDLAEVKDERPGAVADGAVERQLQRGHRGDVDLAADGDGRRFLQLGVDDLEPLRRAARHRMPS